MWQVGAKNGPLSFATIRPETTDLQYGESQHRDRDDIDQHESRCRDRLVVKRDQNNTGNHPGEVTPNNTGHFQEAYFSAANNC